MNSLVRWGKFNLVGIMGAGVQLSSLALFHRALQGHPQIAVAAAVELTLLHNFLWHIHYTWRDRRDTSTRLQQAIRFHLSNGLVSMVGNLVLMEILQVDLHLPLLLANITAICACSLVNFWLGDRWAFSEPTLAGQNCLAASTLPRHSPRRIGISFGGKA